MSTYRITAREIATGNVVYVGSVESVSERLALHRALCQWSRWNDSRYVLKAEPMLLRWPAVERAKA